MSAVPKKKLCWNCEGSVSREVDNCPYCGVYVYSGEQEDYSNWNAGYHSEDSRAGEIPDPIYRVPKEHGIENNEDEVISSEASSFSSSDILTHLKKEVFPILFLMTGSVFFLFGVVLLLFSQNGTLVLQWQSQNGYYFFLLAFPLVAFGWKFLQQCHSEDS